jgi:predicted nuclease of predicted toxin-antitoxin system
VKLLIDEHYANEIAGQLRAAGHDAATVSERRLTGIDDEPLLALAASEDRALLTNNARDFIPLVARWTVAGQSHAGLLLTSDASLPRDEHSIGLHVECLRSLMEANAGDRALADQLRWLS